MFFDFIILLLLSCRLCWEKSKLLQQEGWFFARFLEHNPAFPSDEKLMRAYDARDAFLLGQKMMLNREREDGFEEGIEKGKLEGIKEGEENKAISIAKTLKQMNMDDASISKATGLSIEEIRKLRSDRNKL